MPTALLSSKRGFTIIELLVVIVIIILITGGILPSFNSYIDNQYLVQAQQQVVDDLRSVQNRALTGDRSNYTFPATGNHPGFWGMRFQDGARDYTYFVSEQANPDACNNLGFDDANLIRTSDRLPGSNSVIDLDTTSCLFFSYISGDVTFVPNTFRADAIDIVSSIGLGVSRRVCVGSNGLIYAEDIGNACL